jgi:hypothetical protein
MHRSKLSAIVSLLVVFLSGALVGAMAHRLYMVNTVVSALPGGRKPDPEEVRKHVVDEMRQRVKLDNAQVQQLQQILTHTRERFDEMHKRMNAEGRGIWDKQVEDIKQILRPEQIPLYDQLRAEHDAERQKRHQQQKEREKSR